MPTVIRAKLYAKLEPLVTARPPDQKRVRYALTREEEFLTLTKHKVITRIKTAIKNGAITARSAKFIGTLEPSGNRAAYRP